MTYAPDGKSLLYVSGGNQLFFLTYSEIDGGDTKKDGKPVKEWRTSDRDIVRPGSSDRSFCDATPLLYFLGSTAIFNHVGDGIIVTHHQEHTLRVMDYPSLTVRESPAAHVGGCIAVALDPRGRYLASGGADSIVNMFDLNDWICARTITICEYVIVVGLLENIIQTIYRYSINALSFSHDGEYLAIANAGTYIDIVRQRQIA